MRPPDTAGDVLLDRLVQLEVRVADLERRVLELEAQHFYGYPDTYTGSGFDPDELGIDSEND